MRNIRSTTASIANGAVCTSSPLETRHLGTAPRKPLRIYGVGVSQPVRTVMWTCLISELPFELVYSLPMGSKSSADESRPRMDAKAPEFPSWLRTVPTIDDDGFILAECAAIVCYLADKHCWTSLYPLSIHERSKVHEIMHWFHSSLRNCSLAFFSPIVHPSHAPHEEVTKFRTDTAIASISMLETRLEESGAPFLHGEAPMLTDLLCYGELGQLSPRFLNLYDFGPHKRVRQWMQQMESLPKFEEAHQALTDWIPVFENMRRKM